MLFTGVHNLYKLDVKQDTTLSVGTFDTRTRAGGPPLSHHALR